MPILTILIVGSLSRKPLSQYYQYRSIKKNVLNKAAGSSCLYNVFDLIYLNVVCLLAIKMAIYLDYY